MTPLSAVARACPGLRAAAQGTPLLLSCVGKHALSSFFITLDLRPSCPKLLLRLFILVLSGLQSMHTWLSAGLTSACSMSLFLKADAEACAHLRRGVLWACSPSSGLSGSDYKSPRLLALEGTVSFFRETTSKESSNYPLKHLCTFPQSTTHPNPPSMCRWGT